MQYYHYLIIFTGVVIGVLWGISFYFVKTGKLDAKSWSLKSFGLPQGSVRALLAFLILFLLIFPRLTDGNSQAGSVGDPAEFPPWLIGILGSVVGFYFGSAMTTKKPLQPSTDEQDTTTQNKKKQDKIS